MTYPLFSPTLVNITTVFLGIYYILNSAAWYTFLPLLHLKTWCLGERVLAKIGRQIGCVWGPIVENR